MSAGPFIFLLVIIILVIIVVVIALIFYFKDKNHNHITTCTVTSDCPSGQICFNQQCIDSTTKPVIISNPQHIAIPNQVYTYTVIAVGVPQPTITWTLPSGTWLSQSGDTISGTPTSSNVGTTSVTATATNSQGTTKQSFNIVVTTATIPLEIISTPVNFLVTGRPYAYEVKAISSAGPISYDFYTVEPGTGSNGPIPDTLQVSNNVIYGTLDTSVQLVVDVDDGTTTVSQMWNVVVTSGDIIVPSTLPVLQNTPTALAHAGSSCSTSSHFTGGCGSYKNSSTTNQCFPAYDQTAIGWVAANYSDAVVPIRIGNAWTEDKCPSDPASTSYGTVSIPAGSSTRPNTVAWNSAASSTTDYFTFYRECIVQVMLPVAGTNPATTVMLTLQDYDPRVDYVTILIQGSSTTSYTAFIGKTTLSLV